MTGRGNITLLRDITLINRAKKVKHDFFLKR